MKTRGLGRLGAVAIALAGALAAGVPAPVSAADGPWTNMGANAGDTNGALNGYVSAIAVVGNDVYVGGNFTNAGGVATADYIARWNGSSWSGLGSNGAGNGALNDVVTAIQVIGSDIYVGGLFTNAAGIDAADRLARWDGSSWSPVGSSSAFNNGVYDIAGTATNLYVSGFFTNAAGIPEADRIAHWNGSSWSALGSNGAGDGALNDTATAVVVSGSSIYVGGLFTNAGGAATADYVARWNGSSWSGLGSNGAGNGALNQQVRTLALSGSDLLIGGYFTNAGGLATADGLARWNGSNWSGLGSNGSGNGFFTEAVQEIVVVGGTIYAAGWNVTGSPVVRWTGSSWVNLGPTSVFNTDVETLAVSNQAAYAGGTFTNAAGNARADYIARWAFDTGTRQPDGRIRKGSGTLVGNNIYNTDGTNQTRTAKRARGESVSFFISIQNDGSIKERFKLNITGNTTDMYRVRFFRGTTEITSAVLGGAYETPALAQGAKVTIRVKVKVKSNATAGSNVSRLVTIISKGDPTKKDAVKLVVSRK